MTEYYLRIAGHEHKTMAMDPGIWRCGSIEDGVAIRFGGDLGGWVISFEDLEKAYKAALSFRRLDCTPIPEDECAVTRKFRDAA